MWNLKIFLEKTATKKGIYGMIFELYLTNKLWAQRTVSYLSVYLQNLSSHQAAVQEMWVKECSLLIEHLKMVTSTCMWNTEGVTSVPARLVLPYFDYLLYFKPTYLLKSRIARTGFRFWEYRLRSEKCLEAIWEG